jgi:hypothetical protein
MKRPAFIKLPPILSARPNSVRAAASVLLALLLCGVAAQYVRTEQPSPLVVTVDMSASGGGGVELFLNDLSRPPYRLSIKAGQRTTYEFQVSQKDISLFRLDPTDAANAQLAIFGITVDAGAGESLRIRPGEIAGWSKANLSSAREHDGAVEFTSTTDDPMLVAPAALWKSPPGRLYLPAGVTVSYSEAGGATFLLWAVAVIGFAGIAGLLFLLTYAAAPVLAFVKRHFRHWGSVGALAIVTASVTVPLQNAVERQSVTLTVDMQVSGGNMVEVFLNDTGLGSRQAAIVPNIRKKYVFKDIPHEVHFFRLDPTDQQDAAITIYGIGFAAGGGSLLQWAAEDIRSWRMANISGVNESAGAVSMHAANSDPMLMTNLRMATGGLPAPLERFGEMLLQPYSITVLFLGCFVLFLVCGCTSQRGLMHVGMAAIIHGAGYVLVKAVMQLGISPPAAHAAAGYSSFVGYPKFRDHLASFALAGLALLAAGITARLPWPRAPAAEDAEPASQPGSRGRRWAMHAAVLLFLAMLFQPDFAGNLNHLRQQYFTPQDWDMGNNITWSYLIHAGRLPFRDFWYPYSGFFLQSKPAPFDQIAGWIHCMVCLALFYLGLWHVCGRRWKPALAALGVVLVAIVSSTFVGWTRYILAIDFGLVYLAVERAQLSSARAGWVLAPVAGYVFFMETAQLLYAGAGILAYSAIRFRLRYRKGDLAAQAVHWLRTTALPIFAGILPVLAWLGAAGLLGGFLDFQRSFGVQAQYAAVPADVAGWMAPRLTLESVFPVSYYLLGIACYERFRHREKTAYPAAALLLLSAAALLCMQKQITRPHMATQVAIYPALGALLYGIWIWPRRTAGQVVVAGCFLGCVAGAAVHGNVPGSITQALVDGPRRLASNLRSMASLPEFQRVDATRYARYRFRDFTEMNAVVDALVREPGFSAGQKIYVLGDDPLFYVLLGQDVPYQVNNYNCSPIEQQHKVLAWLEQYSPKFVIWNPANAEFDRVPHVVRLPLIYAYVVENYAFARKVGSYTILQRKPAGQLVDGAYWAAQLGNSIHLGHIPSLVRLRDYAACGPAETGCGSFLLMRVPPQYVATNARPAVQMRAGSADFTLSFDTTSYTREYLVPLERLWFWRPILKGGPAADYSYPPGIELRVLRRRMRDDILY